MSRVHSDGIESTQRIWNIFAMVFTKNKKNESVKNRGKSWFQIIGCSNINKIIKLILLI